MHTHILIATDGSELADRAVAHGLSLARQLGAKVTLVTATEDWSVLDMTERVEAGSSNPIEEFRKLADAHAAKILTAAAEKAQAVGVACETVHARENRPAEAIVATAKTRGCDLIVMASHGRSGLDKVLLGSQTARVLALTNVPVLVYR